MTEITHPVRPQLNKPARFFKAKTRHGVRKWHFYKRAL